MSDFGSKVFYQDKNYDKISYINTQDKYITNIIFRKNKKYLGSYSINLRHFSDNKKMIVAGGIGFEENYPLQIWSIENKEVLYEKSMDRAILSAQFFSRQNYGRKSQTLKNQ